PVPGQSRTVANPPLPWRAMATQLPTRRARPRVFTHPGRVAIVVGTLFAVSLLGALLLSNADTSNQTQQLPIRVDDVSPHPGDLIGPLDTITADLANNLTGVLVIDR